MNSFDKLKIEAFDKIKALREIHTDDMYGAYVRTALNDYAAKRSTLAGKVFETLAAFDLAWETCPRGPGTKTVDVLKHLDLPEFTGLRRPEDAEKFEVFRRAYLLHHIEGYQP